MSLLAFFIAAALLALTPGPGIAYVVARTVAGGRQEGLASCLGTGLGGMLHVLAAALGLSVLLAQSALAFSLMKYVGAAYLIFLGVRLLMQKPPAGDASPVSAPILRVSAMRCAAWRFCAPMRAATTTRWTRSNR
jgi:threonine/homoserine/homoserine lactone efflux protein